jgi:toxin ParE1/3/4
MKFRLSSEAREDLVSIWEYTNKHWGIEQADLYIDALMLRFVWITENRGLWRPRPELGDGLFSCAESRHVVFFMEIQGVVNILRVLHKLMDSVRHLD